MEEKIYQLVCCSVKGINEELNNPDFENLVLDTPLYGLNGNLSSINLVLLVTDVEEAVYNEFGIAITLTDEKAMSQKISPFRSIRSMTSYILKLISDE